MATDGRGRGYYRKLVNSPLLGHLLQAIRPGSSRVRMVAPKMMTISASSSLLLL